MYLLLLPLMVSKSPHNHNLIRTSYDTSSHHPLFRTNPPLSIMTTTTSPSPHHSSPNSLRRNFVQPLDESSSHEIRAREIQRANVRRALKQVPLWSELDAAFRNRIGDALHERSVPPGTIIYQQGDPADTVYLVGEVGLVDLSNDDQRSIGPYEAFGHEALCTDDGQISTRPGTAIARHTTELLSISLKSLARVVGPLPDAIQLSRDRVLLHSVPLFQDSDLEEFEYELLAALIETVHLTFGKEVFVEGDNIDEPALYIVRRGALEVISEESPKVNRIVGEGHFFGEESLTPDENMKFGGPKGGNKYSDETVEVLSDMAVVGKLTLADIDSVIQDLHRLGCKRKMKYKKKLGKDEEEGGSSHGPMDGVASLDELEFHHLFGAGTFGRVWIVSPINNNDSTGNFAENNNRGNVAFALKIQSKRELLDRHQAEGAKRERSVMVKLDHPFICKMIRTFQDEACIYILSQFVQGGELLNLIVNGGDDLYGGLPESAAKFFAAGILEGLTHMHQRRIIYRDLKPENVLLDTKGYAILIDFGFSKYVTDKTYTFCGTPLYLAPEVILRRGHDRGVDYWALGCLVYEMLYGTTPFYVRGIDQIGLFKRIVRGKWSLPKKHNKVHQSAIEFLWGLLQRHPAKRLGCLAGGYRDIKTHEWLKEVNFGKLIKRQIQAPWIPEINGPFDTSNFESPAHPEDEDFLKGKIPLTLKEQIVFQDF